MKSMFLLMVTLCAELIASENHTHWSGIAYQDNEPAKIYFCYDAVERKMVFGLPNNGFVDIPVTELRVDSVQETIRGTISFFSYDHSAKIDLKFSNAQLTGTLLWQGKAIPIALDRDNAPDMNYVRQEIRFSNRDTELSGTLILPKTDAKKPAIVFLPGSGPFTRYWAAYYAHYFAGLGYASLFFDKRGCGQSKGNWVAASLDDLADDADAAVAYLASRKEIDSNRIGMWAISQGGWVAGRASAKRPLDFLIINSGGGATPYNVEMYDYEIALDHAGASTAEKQQARKLLEQYFEYLKTGQDRQALVDSLTESRSKPWYQAIRLDRVLPSEKNRMNWAWVATYDPVTDIQKIHAPTLLMFGTEDRNHPTVDAVAQWESGLKMADNSKYDLKIFKASHGIRVGSHGNAQGWPKFAPQYMETQMNWLEKLQHQ